MQRAAISSVSILLLAPATFLITHPYYYFVLFVLFAFTSVSLLFWSHAQILKYRSICGALCSYRLS